MYHNEHLPLILVVGLLAALMLSAPAHACSYHPNNSTAAETAAGLLGSGQFVGRVRLVDKKEQLQVPTKSGGTTIVNKFAFAVLEQFAGEPVTEITAYSPHDSCGYNQKVGNEEVVQVRGLQDSARRVHGRAYVYRPRPGGFSSRDLLTELRKQKAAQNQQTNASESEGE